MSSYAPLWCKSNFSFLEGASHPAELVEEAQRLGLRSIAVTDRDGVYGMVRAYKKATEVGISLVAGAQVTVAAPASYVAASPLSSDPRGYIGASRGLHADDFADDEHASDRGASARQAGGSGGAGPGWGAHSDEPHEPVVVGYRRGRPRAPARTKRGAKSPALNDAQGMLGAVSATGTEMERTSERSKRGPEMERTSERSKRGPEMERTSERSKRGLTSLTVASPQLPNATSGLVLLASNREGWGNLVRLLTVGRRRCDKGSSLVSWAEVCAHSAGLIALWGGEHSLLLDDAEATAMQVGHDLRDAFGDRLYAMATRHRHAEDARREARLRARARTLRLPVVAATEVLYHSRARRPMQDVLACIRAGVTLATAGRTIRGNDEYDLKAPAVFSRLWADAPAEVARTLEIAARCTFSLTELRYRYPSERLPSGITSAEHLRNLTWDGARARYRGPVPDDVARQVTAELALIEELDYPGYFLTMYEIVSYCKRREILCQGRGSAANSAVCYCLGITAVDPVRMGLLFERFLSRERAEPPDIDLDIEHERREEVIQHVYHVYGRDHAAMVCNVIRYRPRSAIRDVGKVLGIPETALDRAAKLTSLWGDVEEDAIAAAGLVQTQGAGWNGVRKPDETGQVGNGNAMHPSGLPSETVMMSALMAAMAEGGASTLHAHDTRGHGGAGYGPAGPTSKITASTTALLVRLAGEIVEFPRHLSVHPGGFLLGHEPVHSLVPIENATMAGRTVIQWDKNDLEDLGLFKVDLLGLGALHHIHLCLDLLRKHRAIELSMATIPAEDPATYDLMCTADTVGVFQIESRAQMSMLPRLRPRTFYDLVVEISLVRPGPISGGMVHPYLRRRCGQEKIDYPHPCLEPVLAKTLGIPLFQEQVMKLAVVAADYTPGEADQLRRDMAAWRSSGRIEKHRDRLVSRMEQKGIAREFGERVFEQIRGFGEYGFPESHAASFALIAYATSWLRCHYMAEFTCSLLNAQPMGFYSAATIVGDAQRHGVEIAPIDVTCSEWGCLIVLATPTPAQPSSIASIRMGLRWIKGLTLDEATRIIAARQGRPFIDIEDFVRRTHISSDAQTALAEAGAFEAMRTTSTANTALPRRDAIWQTMGWAVRQRDSFSLGGDVGQTTEFAGLSKLDEILWDHRTSDHSPRGHPLGPLRAELRARRMPDAQTISRARHGQRVEYVGIVICRQRPSTASGVTFMTLEDETGFVNLVVWAAVFEKYSIIARSQSLLGVSGTLQVQEGIVHLIASALWVPELSRPVDAIGSRDFH